MTLDEFLARRRLSPIAFADTIGVRYQSVYRYISAERLPTRAIMQRIAAATGGEVTANDFYALASKPPRRPPQRAA